MAASPTENPAPPAERGKDMPAKPAIRTSGPISITGYGLVSAAGAGADALWSAMRERRDCMRTLEQIDARDLVMKRGGEVSDDELESIWAGPDDDRALRMACVGAAEALERARLSPVEIRGGERRVGLVLGTALGSVQTLEALARDDDRRRLAGLPDDDERRDWTRVTQGELAAELARRFQLDGPRWSFSVTCVSGLYALEQAIADLRFGRADAVLCGGLDTLSLFMQSGFCALRALSPSGALRPFDSRHDGIVLGEGAAFVVLERAASARARGVEPVAEIAANELVSDGTHLTSPDESGAGMARAISRALSRAGVESVDCITPTANGSPVYDAMQSRAVLASLGESASRIPVTTWEPAIGHALASTGVLGIVHAAMVIERREMLPAFGVDEIADGCELGYLLDGDARGFRGSSVLALTVGFGGQNGATIVRVLEDVQEDVPADEPGDAPIDFKTSRNGARGFRVAAYCCVGTSALDGEVFEASSDDATNHDTESETLAARFPGRWNARRDLPLGLSCVVSAFSCALEAAGWWRPGQDAHVDGGLVLASDSHALLEALDHARHLGREGAAGISPSGFLFSLPSSAAAVLGILFGLRDYQATLTATGGVQALWHALDRIRLGRAERLAVGAFSRVTPEFAHFVPGTRDEAKDRDILELGVCIVLEAAEETSPEAARLSELVASRGLDGAARDVFSSARGEARLAADELLALTRELARAPRDHND